MARQGISTGSIPNDGTGDSLLAGAVKINENFSEVYELIGDGTNAYVGIVTQIVAGTNISISTSYGSVTVNSLTGGVPYWNKNTTGIHTVSNIGIGTTTASSRLTVSGDASISGVSTLGVTSTTGLKAQHLNVSGVSTLGVTNTTDIRAQQLNVSGVSTFVDQVEIQTGIRPDSDQAWLGTSSNRWTTLWVNQVNASGSISTFSSGVDVTGTTATDQLNVSGVSTFNNDLNLAGSGNLRLGDVNALYVGEGNDLRILHSGGDSVINHAGTDGEFALLTTNELRISNTGYAQTAAVFRPTGATELYYNNSKKFETLGAGATVYGTHHANQLSVSGISTFNGKTRLLDDVELHLGSNGVSGDFKTYHDSGNGYNVIYEDITGREGRLTSNIGGDGSAAFHFFKGSSALARFSVNSIQLYSGNSIKFNTASTGIDVTGTTATDQLNVSGVGTIDGLTIKSSSDSHTDNVIISTSIASTFSGQSNVAIGELSFQNPGAAAENVAIGYESLRNLGNNDASPYEGNIGIGAHAGRDATFTYRNLFIGWSAGEFVTTGSENVIIGGFTGNDSSLDIRTSSNNIILSDGAGNIRIYANGNGDVGIGTTTISERLTVRGGDISVGINTSQGLILTSPSGNRFRLMVEDDGSLKTVAL